MLKIGDKAPEFSIYNSERVLINNSTFAGEKFLILFIPAAFTRVCTKELCTIRDSIEVYDHLNIKVLGISTDSIFTLAKWKSEEKFNFMLASDYNKEVSMAYHAIYENFNYGMKGVSKRAAFLIDENGIIQYAEVLENASDIPNFEKINMVMKA